MSVLDQIISAMENHQLKGLKKKGAPSVTEVEVHQAAPADLAAAGDSKSDDAAAPSGDDDSDPSLLQKLAELYGKDDDEDDEFKKASQPIQVSGSN